MTSRASRGGLQQRPLMIALDHVEWDERPVKEIAESLSLARPHCIRLANFFTRTIDVLNELDEPQVVLWKLEFWGLDTPYEQIPRSDGMDPDLYVKRVFSTRHRIIPYTYNEWGRDRLYALAPSLREHAVELIPVAQKPLVDSPGREAVRRAIGLDPFQTLVGCGGLLHPAKGIEEIVESFLADFPDPGAHLLCSLVIEEDEKAVEQVIRQWAMQFRDTRSRRVHVRAGRYGDWKWMCDFYRSIDLMGWRADHRPPCGLRHQSHRARHGPRRLI
jgi:hypothetical protein